MEGIAGGPWAILLALVAVGCAFTVSAASGLGGSLILVPAMSLILGAKQGIAVAALLLAYNNVGKVIAYRRVIPWAATTGVVGLTILGALVGATAMAAAPDRIVAMAVVAVMSASFWIERRGWSIRGCAFAPALAFMSGATSGFSGTSGPLKGLALRQLELDRFHFVGAASSIVSFAGDLTKVIVFASALPISREPWVIVAAALPVTPAAVLLGWRINRKVGERGYATLFWTVMTGYAVRLVLG